MFNIKYLSSIILLISSWVYAELDIDFKVDYQTTKGDYSSGSGRSSIQSDTHRLKATFLDDITLTHAKTTTKINSNILLNKIKQNSNLTTLDYNFYSDKHGTINLRTDYQSIDNDDRTKKTDDVAINSYQISVLPYREDAYLEFGFSKSKYPVNHLKIKQTNLAYGTKLGDTGWLSLKLYNIKSSDKSKTHEKESFNALKAKYTHFLTNATLGVDSLEFSFLKGERVFAVDGTADFAYNMGDMQTGSFGVASGWKLGEHIDLLTSLKQERYRTNADTNYSVNYFHLNLDYNF
jgi:hypothetical protein